MALLACGRGNTSIDCTVSDAPERDIVVKLLNVNTYSVLDTVRTDGAGHFRYALDVKDGEPEFIYLFDGDTRLAGLLLEKGEKAVVTADTLGHYEVSGSEGSSALKQADDSFAEFTAAMLKAADASDNAALNKLYIDYYRQSVRFVMEHPYSLSVVPVMYRNLGEGAYIFSQDTDAVLFRRACDSLQTVYPNSIYVKALGMEADRRESILKINTQLRGAQVLGFPDLDLPGMDGQKVALSSVEAKVIMVHFWDSSDAEQKMINLDNLMPLYKEFHSKGFEIYSVCLDTDKAAWAACVKGQGLPWINVCDGLGAASPAVSLYNVQSLPTSMLIASGDLTASGASDIAGLRKEISRLLKKK